MQNSKRAIFRKGEKVSLGPVVKEDLETLVIHINDEETSRFLTVNYPISYEMEKDWFDRINKSTNEEIHLAIIENSSNDLVGVTGLHKINHINRTSGFGIALRKKFHQKGYGTEAATLIIRYAFNYLNLRKVCSSAFALNEKSLKLHFKLGFTKEGVKKEQFFKQGRYTDEVILGLFRNDFFKVVNGS